MSYHWDLSLLVEYRAAFGQGLLVTLYLAGSSVLAGTLLGCPLGVVLATRSSSLRPMRWLIAAYIAFFGWLPVLVLLVWMYYLLPAGFGYRPSALVVSVIALSLNLSAFVADVVRGAIGRVSIDDLDAARAIGMSPALRLRRIVLPEVIRNSLPALVALYINQLKWTSLASVIGVEELLHTADTIMIHTYRALEAYTAIAIIYLVMIGLLNTVYLAVQRHPFFLQRR
ncbi:MAG TPA: amino acid ABC transporter permease [Thermoanaerobaculia bacterium]|nr:amino acid ABC transporter permease [Thermoanaerobaculia bacterium]